MPLYFHLLLTCFLFESSKFRTESPFNGYIDVISRGTAAVSDSSGLRRAVDGYKMGGELPDYLKTRCATLDSRFQ
jgi:hypothetical protein